MPHVTHRNPDGSFTHFCTVCGVAPKGCSDKRTVVFVCKCAGPQSTRTARAYIGKPPTSEVMPTPEPPQIEKPKAKAVKKPCNCGGNKAPVRVERDKRRPQ